MIITYGAYCSDTLDKNYIPIVLKYLELYILTHSLNDVLAELSKNSNKKFVKAGSGDKQYKIVAESDVSDDNKKEIVELSDFKIINSLFAEANNLPVPRNTSSGSKAAKSGQPDPRTGNKPRGGQPDPRTGNKQSTTSSTAGKDNTINTSPSTRPITASPPQNPAPQQSVSTSARVGDINRGTISIEPTWIQVTYNDSTFMLGIKVIPIYFKDEENVINELVNDLNRSKGIKLIGESLKRSTIAWYRKIMGPINKIADWLGWEIFDKNAPDGIKIRNKIIYASSSLKNNIFLVLNKNNIHIDVHNTSFKKLFNMLKWCSIIFMDDVNQQVSFCMKSLHGSCSVIPYRVLIHSTQNKGMGQAYQDIDEVQNAVSSVFKLNKSRLSRILGEMNAATSLIDIKSHLIESIYLRENSEKYLTNPDLAIETFKKIRFISKSSNLDDIQNKLANLPIKTPEELNSYINKNSKNFKKLYTFTKKVIKNSVNFEISENDLEIISYILAYRSANMRGPNQLPRLRDILKQFIYDLNKNSKLDLDQKVILFRTLVDVFNKSTSVMKYHDFESDEERRDIIIRNLYVFLNLAPLIVLK